MVDNADSVFFFTRILPNPNCNRLHHLLTECFEVAQHLKRHLKPIKQPRLRSNSNHWLRKDLTTVLKILRVLIILNIHSFSLCQIPDLEVTLKIYKPHVQLDIRKCSSSINVLEEWNSLPVELINCNTVESFKKRIDCYFRNPGYT